MFFPRLRRHAKWMFVFLALVFGLGFVLFGVGAGGVGVGDIFRGAGGTGVQSVSDAREKTEERPEDPEAWRDLATALQTDGETERGDRRAETAVALAPKDASALRELAGLHLALASERQQDAQLASRGRLPRAVAVFPALLGDGRQPSSRIRSRARSTRSRQRAREHGIRGRAAPRRSQAVDAYKSSSSSSPTIRTPSSSSPRRPSRPATRRRRSPRTRRS